MGTTNQEQEMLSKMQESGIGQIHKGARDKATQRLNNYALPNYAQPTGVFDAVMTEVPGLAPLYKGIATADAGIAALVENAPAFLHALPADMRNQVFHPGEFPMSAQVGEMFSEDVGKWEDRLQADRFDYERTPGSNLMRGVGEFAGPIAGSTARTAHGVLRAPMSRLGPSFDEIKRTVDPAYDQSRRDVMKGTAIAGGALATGIGVSKLAKHADEMVHGTKAGKAAAKAIAGEKWDQAVTVIYDTDRSIGMGGQEAVRLGKPPGGELHRQWTGTDARPEHLRWLHEPRRGPHIGEEGEKLIRDFNRQYDLDQLPAGSQKSQADVLEAEYARLQSKTKQLLARRKKLEDEISGREELAYENAYDEAHMRDAEDGYSNSDEVIEMNAEAIGERNLYEDEAWLNAKEELDKIPSARNLTKYDPNTIAYREKRMRAMAAKHGDELWEAERKRLVERLRAEEELYQEHVDELAKVSIKPEANAYVEMVGEAERDLARHMELNPEATKTTSQDILNQIK